MAKDNVVAFSGETRHNIPPRRVIKANKKAFPGGVVMLGYDESGEFLFVSSIADGPEVLWLLELARKRLMEVADGDPA